MRENRKNNTFIQWRGDGFIRQWLRKKIKALNDDLDCAKFYFTQVKIFELKKSRNEG